MLNPIKRVWVPPKKAEPPPAVIPAESPAASQQSKIRNILLDEMPEPEVVEKNSDSAWAEFNSVLQPTNPKSQ